MIRPTHAVVDFAAMRHNIAQLRSRLAPGIQYLAVLKANAYGHGMVHVAQAAVKAGVEFLGVAIPEEGVQLREAGITAPILVFGCVAEAYAGMLVKYDLSATVFTLPLLQALVQQARAQGKTAKVHIKVDTGMNRIGLKTMEEYRALLQEISLGGLVELEGVYTHFAVSELEDKAFTLQQLEGFQPYIRLAKDMGFSPVFHCSNSGAILDLQAQAGCDMVRGGISMYGYHPGPGCGEWADLRPILRWETTIVHIKEILPGETVSYGRQYTAQSVRRIATVPVGYGDGYHRCMSGKAEVLIHGRRAPVVGTICMDQSMVDVTDIPEAQVGDMVYLIGGEGPQAVTAEDLGAWADTISYEMVLAISERVPRVYVNEE